MRRILLAADGRGGPADDSKQETTLTSRQCQPQMLHVRDPIFDSRFSKSAGAAKPRKHGARVRDSPSVEILKRSSRWACVKGCGACCYLAMDQRPDMAGNGAVVENTVFIHDGS